MRIEIEIPKEFESDYTGDKFKDFFSRVLCDIEEGVMCGNYEKEIAEMFTKAFDESRTAYDVEKVVEELEEENQRLKKLRNDCIALSDHEVCDIENKAYNFAIKCVRNGWKE